MGMEEAGAEVIVYPPGWIPDESWYLQRRFSSVQPKRQVMSLPTPRRTGFALIRDEDFGELSAEQV